MPKHVFTEEARQQVNDIRNYTLNKWGKHQAKNYLTELCLTLNQLADTPLIGTQ